MWHQARLIATVASSVPAYRYDRRQTYLWNFENAPPAAEASAEEGIVSNGSHVRVPPPTCDRAATTPVGEKGGPWKYLDWAVSLPCAVAAGPLLNGRWILYAARCGFDVLTHKTVRSRWRASHPLPNLQPVELRRLDRLGQTVQAVEHDRPTWAVSFGMPSQPPELWRRDIRWARERLAPSQKLVVSVVGTVRSTDGRNALADDFARCARWAFEAGADAIEANFSCPNVVTPDAHLQHDPAAARNVARTIRGAIGRTPLLVKLGFLPDDELCRRLVDALGEFTDALVMTNSIAARVTGRAGELLFDGRLRGICGAAIRDASLRQVERFAEIVARRNAGLQIIGVGGVFSANDIRRYLSAGATAVQTATAFMQDPTCVTRWRAELRTR
ncbi:MAG: hypothetical protein D6725_05370 [Planctomycetota bacterium]|nr:MAG: hypothetical protein D6725_05370 [Planctomycetota bacterium]